MIFTAPLGLLALAAIPAIVAIHLFRRRFPDRPIAGLFLWQLARQTPAGTGRIARLPITRSLILECLAALALALIVAGARVSTQGAATHLVVLLDDSASMAAVDARGESARDRAVRRIVSEIDRLGRSARVTIVTSGDRPSVVAGPAAFPGDARAALAAWRPAARDHPLSLGIRLARELAGRSGRIMIVTDLAPEARGESAVEGALWVSVGVAVANVGIVGAERSVAPDEGRGAISLTLANQSGAGQRRRVDVVAGDKTVVARELDVPEGTSSLTLPIPPGLPAVRVTLSADALARDNEVMLVERRPRIVGVANRLPDGRGRAALSTALHAVSGVTRSEPGHLAFVDATALDVAAAPGVWRVGMGRPPPSWRAAGDARDFIGPFLMEKRHPLLAGMTLDGVVWTGAAPLTPGLVRPLVSAGDAVLIAAPSNRGRADSDVLLNLDLERTNLIRSPDWPILVSNLVELRRQALPGPERWNYRIGEWVRVNLGRDPTGPLRWRCGTLERALPSGRQLEFTAPPPGGLLQILEGDDIRFELGVNFLDDAESDLRRQTSADAGAFGDAPALRRESGPSSDPLFWILLAIAGSAIAANWALPATPRRQA
jgi:hypothetical protein